MPRLRRRALLYAALALAAPLPAFALTTGGAASLDATASLNGCGVQGSAIACSMAVSFNRVSGADYYTARIIKVDGSVQDFGTVAEGSDGGRVTVDLGFGYAGEGAYTVSVSAWGRGEGRVAEDTEQAIAQTPDEDEAVVSPAPDPDDGDATQDVGSSGAGLGGERPEPQQAAGDWDDSGNAPPQAPDASPGQQPAECPPSAGDPRMAQLTPEQRQLCEQQLAAAAIPPPPTSR